MEVGGQKMLEGYDGAKRHTTFLIMYLVYYFDDSFRYIVYADIKLI